MTPTERVKEQYLRETRKLLCDYPEVLRTFEQLWQSTKLREAYLSVDEAIRKLRLAPSQEHRKADEDFYWEFVN